MIRSCGKLSSLLLLPSLGIGSSLPSLSPQRRAGSFPMVFPFVSFCKENNILSCVLPCNPTWLFTLLVPRRRRLLGNPHARIGVKLPGLREWRMRRGLNQTELAQMAGVAQIYLTGIETGRRGCNPEVAQKLAEILDVNLQMLRGKAGKGAPAPKVAPSRPPLSPEVASRYIHRAYLKYILTREVGTSYSTLS
jgi:transcriptional regulator with XRE-family HTH domain